MRAEIWIIIPQLPYGAVEGDFMQGFKENELVYDENSIVSLAVMSVLGDRAEQQDCFGYLLDEKSGIVTVCDGMGGLEGGRLASSVAVQCYLDHLRDIISGDISRNLSAATKEANKRVFSLKNEGINGGSTAVTVVVNENELFWSSVGDSRAYLFRSGAYAQITQDHNYKLVLDEKVKAGLIGEEEYQQDMVRGEALICHLGLESVDLVDYNSAPFILSSGDIIVVMTDGLYKILSDEEIFTVINNFNDISEALSALEMKAAKTAKESFLSRDNMTVALIKIK